VLISILVISKNKIHKLNRNRRSWRFCEKKLKNYYRIISLDHYDPKNIFLLTLWNFYFQILSNQRDNIIVVPIFYVLVHEKKTILLRDLKWYFNKITFLIRIQLKF